MSTLYNTIITSLKATNTDSPFAALRSTPSMSTHTITAYVDHTYHNGTEQVIVIQDVRCSSTGEVIRDHININTANGMSKIAQHTGSIVTLDITWKLYANQRNFCIGSIQSVR